MANAKESLHNLKQLSKANILVMNIKHTHLLMSMFFFILGTLHIIIR